jgi:hypothetical protein
LLVSDLGSGRERGGAMRVRYSRAVTESIDVFHAAAGETWIGDDAVLLSLRRFAPGLSAMTGSTVRLGRNAQSSSQAFLGVGANYRYPRDEGNGISTRTRSPKRFAVPHERRTLQAPGSLRRKVTAWKR